MAVMAALVYGCTSYAARRVRYKSLAPGEFIVRAEAEAFHVGGRALFVREDCGAESQAPAMVVESPNRCPESILGEGDVVERIDRFSFVVRADPGVPGQRATRVLPLPRR